MFGPVWTIVTDVHNVSQQTFSYRLPIVSLLSFHLTERTLSEHFSNFRALKAGDRKKIYSS